MLEQLTRRGLLLLTNIADPTTPDHHVVSQRDMRLGSMQPLRWLRDMGYVRYVGTASGRRRSWENDNVYQITAAGRARLNMEKKRA